MMSPKEHGDVTKVADNGYGNYFDFEQATE